MLLYGNISLFIWDIQISYSNGILDILVGWE